MKLAALLNFYDEPESDLVRCVASLALAQVGHVVAVDGRYTLFPGPHAASPPPQQDALRAACSHAGMGLTLHIPTEPWENNEVEKRSFMHALALAVTGYSAWHLVIDADEIIDIAPEHLLEHLSGVTEDVATVACREVGGGECARRRLFRARPLWVGPSHCRYVDAATKAVLADTGEPAREVPAASLPGFLLSHRHSQRSESRLRRKAAYYSEFPEGGHALCERGCGRAATQRVRTNWRLQGELISDPLDVCQFCAEVVRGHTARTLRDMGYNPDRLAL